MKRPSAAPRSTVAFTLVELLVVIAIIVILMSLLLTAVPAVKEAARKTEARNTANQIVVAINAYYTEYAKYPVPDSASSGGGSGGGSSGGSGGNGGGDPDYVVGDVSAMGATAPNNTIFYTLRNIDAGDNAQFVMNPRRVTFYEGKSASVNSAGPRGGFYDRTKTGGTPGPADYSALYDPWGHQYGVIMDQNADDRIDLTGFYNDFAGVQASGRAPRRKVGAFAMGKDEKLGNNGDKTYRNGSELSDDVISWE